MKKLLAIILTFGLIFCLCACGADSNGPTANEPVNSQTQSETDTSSKEDAVSKFEVTVKDTDGNAVKGVMVQLCKDTCVPALTDENGVATFNTEITDEHKLSVMSCPDGYEYTGEAEIYLEDGDTEYTIEISKK